ncbi:MAG: hypothetical protein GXP32_09610, partial [Kiritimatiellaeota bacterium]|nr:hypothetical protein [Kiritimatiellota bacterium]
MNELYQNLRISLERYSNNEIDASELKHATAPLGIYQQRNGKPMLRVRVSGGHMPTERLTDVADIMDLYDIDYSHITSRQDLQLHGS